MGMIPQKIVYWVSGMGIGTHTQYTQFLGRNFGFGYWVWVYTQYPNPDFFVCECMILPSEIFFELKKKKKFMDIDLPLKYGVFRYECKILKK